MCYDKLTLTKRVIMTRKWILSGVITAVLAVNAAAEIRGSFDTSKAATATRATVSAPQFHPIGDADSTTMYISNNPQVADAYKEEVAINEFAVIKEKIEPNLPNLSLDCGCIVASVPAEGIGQTTTCLNLKTQKDILGEAEFKASYGAGITPVTTTRYLGDFEEDELNDGKYILTNLYKRVTGNTGVLKEPELLDVTTINSRLCSGTLLLSFLSMLNSLQNLIFQLFCSFHNTL